MNQTTIALILLFMSRLAFAQNEPPVGSRITSVTHVIGSAGIVAAEATDVTAIDDTAGSLAGTYFKFSDAGDAHKYLAWFKVSGTGTAPVVASTTAIEVDITSGDLAASNAGAARAAITAAVPAGQIVVSGGTTHVILTNALNGASTDVADGTPPTGFGISKTVNGVSAALAISGGSVLGSLLGWEICNNGVNTSTWLAVGKTVLDPTVDGVRLGKGQCFKCMSCTASALKAYYVASQAATNGYSIIQFKQ